MRFRQEVHSEERRFQIVKPCNGTAALNKENTEEVQLPDNSSSPPPPTSSETTATAPTHDHQPPSSLQDVDLGPDNAPNRSSSPSHTPPDIPEAVPPPLLGVHLRPGQPPSTREHIFPHPPGPAFTHLQAVTNSNTQETQSPPPPTNKGNHFNQKTKLMLISVLLPLFIPLSDETFHEMDLQLGL